MATGGLQVGWVGEAGAVIARLIAGKRRKGVEAGGIVAHGWDEGKTRANEQAQERPAPQEDFGSRQTSEVLGAPCILPPMQQSPAPVAGPSPAPNRRRFLPLLAALALLICTGVAFIAYGLYLAQPWAGREEFASPWDVLRPARILTGLASSTLAGSTPDLLYRQAMASDSVETVAAEALTAAYLPASQRLGWLAVAARRYALAGERERAIELYQVAADLTVLQPNLTDSQRAESLARVAEGWVELGEEDLARGVLAQISLIAERSPMVESPVRKHLLDEVGRLYDALGDADAARAARALPADADAEPFAPTLDPLAQIQAVGPPAFLQAVTDATVRRQAAAQAFVSSWAERKGQVAPGALSQLEQALLDEDLLRSAYYSARLQDVTLSPLERARVQWDQAQWLTIKHRAASDLYGATLVANWKAELPAIRQTTHDAFVQAEELLRKHVETLPAEQQVEATYNLYRQALTWGLLGLNPDADLVFLANAMNDALLQWQNASGLATIASIGDGDEVHFELIDTGQAE